MTGIFSGYIGGTRDDNISSGFGGIDGDIGRGALISAIVGIGSINFSRRISGGIVGVSVKIHANISSSIDSHINYGIRGCRNGGNWLVLVVA